MPDQYDDPMDRASRKAREEFTKRSRGIESEPAAANDDQGRETADHPPLKPRGGPSLTMGGGLSAPPPPPPEQADKQAAIERLAQTFRKERESANRELGDEGVSM